MKRLFLCALVVAVCSQALFAQSTQPCIVLQYNQKEAKSPLPGVEVMASNAGSTVSDNAGKLTLSFRTLKPGDKVNLISARKAGFELFNAEAVAQWTISRDQSPFTLVMVKKDYFDQLKAKLTQTSTDSYRTKYEQAARELEQQKKAGKLKEEEFNRKYDALEAQYLTQLSNLDNYIDQFARIDLSDVSEEERQILEMVEQGRIDEAVKAYEVLDISGKLHQARESKKALEEAKARIEKEAAGQELAIRELKAKQEREIATLKLAGGKENYDKIGRMLKENALADTTDFDAVWQFASFAKLQKDYQEAERFYLMCLNASEGTPDHQDAIWNNLGFIYYYLRDYDQAENYWNRTWERRTQLFARNPDAYRMDFSRIQNTLGFFYYTIQDYTRAEEYLLRSLEHRMLLYERNPGVYGSSVAQVQINLSLLYSATQDYEKALEAIDKAIELTPDDAGCHETKDEILRKMEEKKGLTKE